MIVLENRVYVYNFADLRLIDAIDTCNNPKGLCALNTSNNCDAILATPANQKGFIRIAYYGSSNTNTVFKAHDNAIEAIALSSTGDFLATASETGQKIRFFNIKQGEEIRAFSEVTRGTTNANINCLVFDNMSMPDYLACSSDRDTIHVFVVEHSKQTKKNPTSGLINKDARAYCKFTLKQNSSFKVCGFDSSNQKLIMVTQTGQYYEEDIVAKEVKANPKQELLTQRSQGQGQGGI